MILELTLTRLRQIVTAIRLRRHVDQKRERRLVSWQTRTIARFISYSVPLTEDQENPLIPLLNDVVLDDEEKRELEYAASAPRPVPATRPAVRTAPVPPPSQSSGPSPSKVTPVDRSETEDARRQREFEEQVDRERQANRQRAAESNTVAATKRLVAGMRPRPW